MKIGKHLRCLPVAIAALAATSGVRADLVLSTNDGHTAMLDGKLVLQKNPMPDTLSVIDASSIPPRVIDTIDVPGSVVGPPMSVWLAPEENFAIVTSATRADATQKTGIADDDRVSVVDLHASPPAIVQRLNAGLGATAVRVSPDGTLALICNRVTGTISVFHVRDRRLEPAGEVELGKGSGPSGLVFLKNGKTALVTRFFDNQVSVLHIDGTRISIDPRPITTGLSPYTIDINAAGTLAAVSNMGRGDGDVDTVSLIDLTAEPYRTVETVGVASGPEPLKFSPDGAWLAVGSANGSVKPPGSPFHHDHGLLQMFKVDGKHLRLVATAPVGSWSEGVAFSRDGRTVMVQNMVEQNISILRWDGVHLTEAPPLTIGSGPSALATSWP